MTLNNKILNLGKKTRVIYHKQHKMIASDNKTFNRIYGIYKDQNYGLGDSWFNNKVVLDAGCGNFGALLLRFYRLKCKKIYACDIGDKWVPLLKKNLINKKVKLDSFNFSHGDVLNLPYKDNYFDFVAVNGVFPHLKNLHQVERGFKEGARVTKKNGYFFSSYGVSGGLIQKIILPAVRNFYKLDSNFKKFIDNVDFNLMSKIINDLENDSLKLGGGSVNPKFLKKLFGQDFCVFLKNHIQSPSWLTNECSPSFVTSLYKKYNFRKILRIKKFVKRSDIRRYFAPLHYKWENSLSKILYGNGYVQFIGQKK
jgi:ubiquinone/menaquinone biosynthesis C-methylase UbiE